VRYFVLKAGFFYYSKLKDDRPLGLVYLRRNNCRIEESLRKSHEFRVIVTWPERAYLLTSENKAEWIENIRSAMIYGQQHTVTDPPPRLKNLPAAMDASRSGINPPSRQRNSIEFVDPFGSTPDSLITILQIEKGVEFFKLFLESEYSAENILLWQDVNWFVGFALISDMIEQRVFIQVHLGIDRFQPKKSC
jgi:hypothetical protein